MDELSTSYSTTLLVEMMIDDHRFPRISGSELKCGMYIMHK